MNTAAAEKPRPAYCFFTDDHTKSWKVSTDKSGNVVVSAKGYAEDPRYKAILSPATVSGATAEIAPDPWAERHRLCLARQLVGDERADPQ